MPLGSQARSPPSLALTHPNLASAPLSLSDIKNKLSVLLVALIKQDYPERWPSFFTDFMSLLNQGTEVVDMFLRTLKTMDQEVVEAQYNRSQEEQKHNTLIKDTLRETCIGRIVEAMHGILVAFNESMPELTRLCLQTLAEYIEWVDINLVANDTMVPSLYTFMSKPALQVDACGCIHEIMSKRMDKMKKLALLRKLSILDVLAALDLEAVSEPFACKVASLVNTLGVQLIECLNSLKSDGSAAERQAEAEAAMEQVLGLANTLMARHWKVGSEVVQFILDYVNMLKGLQVSPAQGRCGARARACTHTYAMSHSLSFPPVTVEAGRRVFVGLTRAMEYPEWYDFDDPDDREERFDHYRALLIKTFGNMGLCMPQQTMEWTRSLLAETLANLANSPFVRVEVALKMLHLLGQHIKGAMRGLGEEPFRSMIGGMLTSDVSKHPHPQVVLVYFNTGMCGCNIDLKGTATGPRKLFHFLVFVVLMEPSTRAVNRYSKFLEQYPEFLGGVLTAFVDNRGMRHPHPKVRSRACYLLLQVFKSFSESQKRHVRPYIDQMLKVMHEILEPVLSRGMQRGVQTLIAYDDCLYLCEVIGMLIGSSMTGDKVREYFAQTLAFFKKQLDAAIAQRHVWLNQDPELAGKRLSQVVNCIGCLSKPLQKDASKICDLLDSCFDSVVQMHAILPQHAGVRAKTIFFLHRMTDILGDRALPRFPLVLEALVAHCEAQNVGEFLTLVTNLVNTYKAKLFPTLDTLFFPLVSKVFECIQSYAHIDQQSAARCVNSVVLWSL